jgi:hypothetical protein
MVQEGASSGRAEVEDKDGGRGGREEARDSLQIISFFFLLVVVFAL